MHVLKLIYIRTEVATRTVFVNCIATVDNQDNEDYISYQESRKHHCSKPFFSVKGRIHEPRFTPAAAESRSFGSIVTVQQTTDKPIFSDCQIVYRNVTATVWLATCRQIQLMIAVATQPPGSNSQSIHRCSSGLEFTQHQRHVFLSC